MKLKSKIFYLSLVSISLIGLHSCSNSAEEVVTEINMDNVVVSDFTIDGMVCAMGCAKTIQDELSAMNGIASCEVSFENGTAHVEYDESQLSENEVIAVIEGLADGQYKVNKGEAQEVESEEVDEDSVEEGEENEETITEVSLPSFEMPNLVELLFNQL